jgi:hypothetical protein
MIYSACKQIVGPDRLRTSMQDLPIDSVICFGSTIDYAFCVDTVFAKRPLPVSCVRDAWREVRRQVLDAGLVLAVSLKIPPKRAVQDVPHKDRRQC